MRKHSPQVYTLLCSTKVSIFWRPRYCFSKDIVLNCLLFPPLVSSCLHLGIHIREQLFSLLSYQFVRLVSSSGLPASTSHKTQYVACRATVVPVWFAIQCPVQPVPIYFIELTISTCLFSCQILLNVILTQIIPHWLEEISCHHLSSYKNYCIFWWK